jgi:hypothetical protein
MKLASPSFYQYYPTLSRRYFLSGSQCRKAENLGLGVVFPQNATGKQAFAYFGKVWSKTCLKPRQKPNGKSRRNMLKTKGLWEICKKLIALSY